jgi:two-component system chemotaxis response regulator CheB
MKKIRVLIVEDSQVAREFLEHIVSEDPRLEVAASVASAEEGLRILAKVSPDVISMDVWLPGMNGFKATQRIMSERPTPIVIVSASAANTDQRVTIQALQAGALAVIEKPAVSSLEEYDLLAKQLCTQLAIMSQVKLVRMRRQPRPSQLAPGQAGASPGGYRMLGIASSTGGPNALVRLLGRLGPSFPIPIALVQHITSGFLEGFAAWLESSCPFEVEIVRETSIAEPGKVYVAAADRHLIASPTKLSARAGAKICGQIPSGTVLFTSMATTLGAAALGVVLTGMGSDGAEGLLAVRKRGGYTIAEDESTAVVYGMPLEAVSLGAISELLPLHAIAPRILALTSAGKDKE